MLFSLQNSFASMNVMVRQRERTANNLAYVKTVGYKHDRSLTQTRDEHLDAEGAPLTIRASEVVGRKFSKPATLVRTAVAALLGTAFVSGAIQKML